MEPEGDLVQMTRPSRLNSRRTELSPESEFLNPDSGPFFQLMFNYGEISDELRVYGLHLLEILCLHFHILELHAYGSS